MREIIKKPHISEKATALAEDNKYVFIVNNKANKIEVAEAIEEMHGVNVENVNIVSIPTKKRRLGATEGVKKGYKKAIVKIKEGETIEIIAS